MAAATSEQLAESQLQSGNARLRGVWEAIRRPDIKVISTDVFDTLVWRQAAEPEEVFRILGERLQRRGQLATRLAPAAFQTLRRVAELEARQERAAAFNDREVNLEEIYALLPEWVFGHPTGRQIAKDAELALEHELILPDLDVVAVLRAAVRATKRVVAVSDTYFSGPEVGKLLDQPGLDGLELERVFLSSEHRQGKTTGLFSVVLRELDVPAAAVVHLGDSPVSDILPARAIGISTVTFERHPPALQELLRQERRFAEPPPAYEQGSGLAPELSAIRGKVAARWEGTGQPSSLRPFWETGALVLGPVMSGFADWVQARAAEFHLSRLFCFMRDGHFLMPLVDRAGQALELPARTEQLWLNRAVLGAASLGAVTRGELARMLIRRHTPTLVQLLRSLGLGIADLPNLATHADTSLDDAVLREAALEAIVANEALCARILDHGRTQRERVARYIENMLGGEQRMGVVDLGWGGTAQFLLQRTLGLAGQPVDIQGFYMMTHERTATYVTSDGLFARGFLGEMGVPREASDALHRSPEILEQLCMPGHGSQIGLDERLEPILTPPLQTRLQMVEAAAVRQGVEAFQRECSRYRVCAPGKFPSLADAAHLLRPLLRRQLEAPTPVEAALLGAWMHDENDGSSRGEEIAGAKNAARLRHLTPDQLRDVPMYWPAGLAALADPATAELYAAGACGELAWQHLSSDLETGPFVVEAVGVGVQPWARIEVSPKRNQLGLTSVFGRIDASEIHQIVLRPAERPCVLRLDYLELDCHVQGALEPTLVALAEPQEFLRLKRNNCFVLNPNVYVVHKDSPELRLDLREDIAGAIFRVDVRVGLAVLPISQILPAPGRLRSVEEAGVVVERLERELDQISMSLSWRVTRPLRKLKRLLHE